MSFLFCVLCLYSNVSANEIADVANGFACIRKDADVAEYKNLILFKRNEALQLINSQKITGDNPKVLSSNNNGAVADKSLGQQLEQHPKVDIMEISKTDFALGNKEAPVRIIEYSSPTCAHCSYFHSNVYPRLYESYIATGKISYVIRPLVMNKVDLDAVVLMYCFPEKFYSFMDTLYSTQDAWAFNKDYKDKLTNIGVAGGVTPEKYAQCSLEKGLREIILDNLRNLIQTFPNDVTGTPIFIINGKIIVGAMNFESLEDEISSAVPRVNQSSQTNKDNQPDQTSKPNDKPTNDNHEVKPAVHHKADDKNSNEHDKSHDHKKQ